MRDLEKAAFAIGCAVTAACSVTVGTGPKGEPEPIATTTKSQASQYDPTPAEQLEDERDRQAGIQRKQRKAPVNVGTRTAKEPQRRPEPQFEPDQAAAKADVDEFNRRFTEGQRANDREAAQQAEQAKEDSCRSEYTQLVAAENEKAGWHPPSQPTPSSSCSTGIPSGTYKYVGTSGHVTISVSADGCATYEAGQQRSWKRARVVEDERLGDRNVEYTKAVYCEVSGTASGAPNVKAQPKKFSDASMCFDGILAKDKVWVVSRGAAPQVSVMLTGGMRVAVRQVSKTPELVQQPVVGGASGQLEMFRSITGEPNAKTEGMTWCAKLQRWNSGERALSSARGYE